ncbi:MAG TPA: acyl-CoA dehydrogenase family protein [Gemmatimonadales bacterium]
MEHAPELQRLVDTAREIATTVTALEAEESDRDATWPRATMHALTGSGLTALQAPRDVGGHDGGMRAMVLVSEAIARESASAALCFAMHCVGTAVIAARATREQTERYLAPIARGEHLTTLALSEPGTGAYLFFPQARLAPTDDGWEVTGTKSFVTNGSHADSYVISTAAADGAQDGVFSCVLVERDAPGLLWSDQWAGLGMRGNDSRTLQLEGARVRRSGLLGAEGDQLWYVFEVVAPYFLMAMAGTYLGVAQAALDEATQHVGARRYAHSGELLGSAPVVSHRLGEMWTRMESARRLVYAAATRGDAMSADSLQFILSAKVAAVDAAVTLANEAMTLCGGIAYRENSRLARVLRDARAGHVMAPTTDMLQTWLGRALLNMPLL